MAILFIWYPGEIWYEPLKVKVYIDLYHSNIIQSNTEVVISTNYRHSRKHDNRIKKIIMDKNIIYW